MKARVAQLAESGPSRFGVVGSSPIRRSTSIASSNTSNVGFRHPLLAAFYAAAAGKVDPHAMACDCVARHRPGRQRGFNSRQTDATTHSRINARPAAPFHSARLTPRAPSPAAAGIFYLTGQHVRIVTTARNCSARSYGDSRMTLRYHTNAELERMRDSNWRDQQSLLQRPKSGAVTRTIKALQVRMVEIIDEINKRISIVDDQPF